MLEMRNEILKSQATVPDLNDALREVKESMALPLGDESSRDAKLREEKILDDIVVKGLGVDAKYVTLEITSRLCKSQMRERKTF